MLMPRSRLAGGIVAVGGGKGACSYRWATARIEEARREGAQYGAPFAEEAAEAAEAAEDEAQRAAKEMRLQQAAAKKKARVVTKGGGYKAKKGGTSRTG